MTTISTFMSDDHYRLDALLATAVSGDDTRDTAAAFAEFSDGLLRHIEWEEEILFPVFEERTGMVGSGPTAVMRMEHDRIRRLLAEGRDQMGGPGLAIVIQELTVVLAAHNHKEEAILYPWMDQQLTPEQTAEVLQMMSG